MDRRSAFRGTESYIASDDLVAAVNVAVQLGEPLLIKGEPGTGKTMLAEAVAQALGMDLLVWGIESTTKAQDGLYVYDTVQRLYDSQFGDRDLRDVSRDIRLGTLRRASTRPGVSCCSSTRSTRPTSSSPTTCSRSWTG